jgi:serine protease Do
MRWPSQHRKAPAALAGLVAVLVVGSLVALAPHLGFTATAQHLWTDGPLAVSPTTTSAPAWVEIARALKPAVVNISTRLSQTRMELPSVPDENNPFNDFFRQFRDRPAPRVLNGLGSGFIISPDGMIVTNNHVVDGATEIKVTMSDGREFTAKVLGRDPKTDVALLKIDAQHLPVIALGDTSELQVGEPVMAIGNPFGLEQTVTTGIVSATGRVIGEGPYDDFIQTDAAINPGNSGGPLINARGQAIGINTAIFSQTGGSVGVGFAIPINLAKSVIIQLASTGHVERGWLGVTIQRVTPKLANSFNLPEAQGALVSDVTKDSPAAKAGLKDGDVIVGYNGRKVARSDDLPRAVADTPVGHEVPITVLRDGQRVTLQARVARLSDEQSEQSQVASHENKGALGLSVQTVTADVARKLSLDQSHGVVIRDVRDGSPAANAGLRAGDVIMSVDRRPVKNVEEMSSVIQKHRAGTPTLFLVHRDGGNLYVPVG